MGNFSHYGVYRLSPGELTIFHPEAASEQDEKLVGMIKAVYPGLFIYHGDIKMSIVYWLGEVEIPPEGRFYIQIDDIPPSQVDPILTLLENHGIARVRLEE